MPPGGAVAHTLISFGFVIAAFVPRAESAQAVTSLIGFPMMLFGGSYFALNDAPPYLQPVIYAMPLTYLNHALREVMLYGNGFEALHRDLLVKARQQPDHTPRPLPMLTRTLPAGGRALSVADADLPGRLRVSGEPAVSRSGT